MIMYKAAIEYLIYEDDLEHGESMHNYGRFTNELTESSKYELKQSIALECHITSWDSEVDSEQINNYDWATEYASSYSSDKYGCLATTEEIAAWKKGEANNNLANNVCWVEVK